MISDDLTELLGTMEYPALRDDLVREAGRSGCDDDVLESLEALPLGPFNGAADVREALAEERSHAFDSTPDPRPVDDAA